MSRDAFAAKEIWQDHRFKILGPPSSTAGLFHGVLYYYLIAPFYGLGAGDPRYPALALSILNVLTIIPIYLLAKKIFKDNKWAFLAAFFYAISFEAIQYGPWLSNPGPALLATAFFFYGLYLWLENKNYGLPTAVFSAAIATQFQFFFIYLFFLIPVFKYIFKTKESSKEVFYSVILGLLVLNSFIVSIIKFNIFWQTAGVLFNISKGSGIVSENPFSSMLLNYINNLAGVFSGNFFPLNLFIGGILGFFTFYVSRKNRFLLFALFAGVPLFIFGGHNAGYDNLILIAPSIVAFTLLFKKIYLYNKKLGCLFIVLITISNLFTIWTNLSKGQKRLVIPKEMLLSKQLQLIDKTYEIAKGEKFSINSLTLPLWTNTTWAYLYGWYGQSKYGYLPEFYGKDQIGMPGEKELKRTAEPRNISFFIIEPNTGIPPYFFSKEIADEDGRTKLEKEFDYGDLKMQLRKPY